MMPIEPSQKKILLEAAQKAFPKKTLHRLEKEFDELQSLEAERFTTEAGLPPAKEKRLEQLADQFYPKTPSSTFKP